MKGIIVLSLALLFAQVGFADQQVVNVYNWSHYIPKKVISLFEKQTGIHVNYTTYTSNDELYAKLLADPDAGYDVVFPSSYYVQRMANEKMLHRLDLKRLTNVKNLNPVLLNRQFDRGNHYSLPYLWGTTGLMINKKYFNPKTVTKWQDLWQKRFRNQLLMLDDVRDVFSVALISLGDSINTRNPEKIRQAYLRLKQLLPNIKLFTNDAIRPVYIDEDAVVGMILSGDASGIVKSNLSLRYVYPKQPIVWIDCMSIPAHALHLNNAYRFMSFILKPKVAEMISADLGYSSPNFAAVKLMPLSVRKNPIVNPSSKLLRHAQIEADVGRKANALYLHYWELLKLSA